METAAFSASEYGDSVRQAVRRWGHRASGVRDRPQGRRCRTKCRADARDVRRRSRSSRSFSGHRCCFEPLISTDDDRTVSVPPIRVGETSASAAGQSGPLNPSTGGNRFGDIFRLVRSRTGRPDRARERRQRLDRVPGWSHRHGGARISPLANLGGPERRSRRRQRWRFHHRPAPVSHRLRRLIPPGSLQKQSPRSRWRAGARVGWANGAGTAGRRDPGSTLPPVRRLPDPERVDFLLSKPPEARTGPGGVSS